jgi:hypothetical protein
MAAIKHEKIKAAQTVITKYSEKVVILFRIKSSKAHQLMISIINCYLSIFHCSSVLQLRIRSNSLSKNPVAPSLIDEDNRNENQSDDGHDTEGVAG